MPFLNSTKLRPSDRATDGSRLPNSRTATMPKMSQCTMLKPPIAIFSRRSDSPPCPPATCCECCDQLIQLCRLSSSDDWSSSLYPFLNSETVCPSERATEGNRL